MNIKFVFATLIATGLTLSSCSNDNTDITTPDSGEVPAAVQQAFSAQYKNATNVKWTRKGTYAVAQFTDTDNGGTQSVAWYDVTSAKWSMTDGDVPYSALPQAVRTAFESTEYAQSPWTKEDEADVLSRNGAETIYVIEVEKNENGTETSIDLYITAEGVIVKTLIDQEADNDYEDYLPQSPAGSITDWIKAKYADAKIVDTESEDGLTEVDFVSGGLSKEALFDAQGNWIQTKTEYAYATLQLVPEAVIKAALSGAANAKVDEVTLYETAKAGNYYRVDLENRYGDDTEIFVSTDGTVIDRPSTDNGSGNAPGAAIDEDAKAFIEKAYPGAVVLEKENERGYTVIEIRHNGVEKEVRFNGSGKWIDTKWDIPAASLPSAVAAAISAAYPQYAVEEAEATETEKGITYSVELEDNRDNELKVTFAADGKVLSETRG